MAAIKGVGEGAVGIPNQLDRIDRLEIERQLSGVSERQQAQIFDQPLQQGHFAQQTIDLLAICANIQFLNYGGRIPLELTFTSFGSIS